MKECKILSEIADRAMKEKGLEPNFPPEVLAELKGIKTPALPSPETRDLRHLFGFRLIMTILKI